MDERFIDFDAVVTVCDAGGKILSMNPASISHFEADGGAALIGKNLFTCHSADSTRIIRELIASGRSNVYTVERAGAKKLVFQAPWYTTDRSGKRVVGGLTEIVIPLPETIRSIKRG
jgi:hypothetical protein